MTQPAPILDYEIRKRTRHVDGRSTFLFTIANLFPGPTTAVTGGFIATWFSPAVGNHIERESSNVAGIGFALMLPSIALVLITYLINRPKFKTRARLIPFIAGVCYAPAVVATFDLTQVAIASETFPWITSFATVLLYPVIVTQLLIWRARAVALHTSCDD